MSVVSNLLVPIENQRPEKTLRFLLLSESRRTLPHPHNRLVIGSSPTAHHSLRETQRNSGWLLQPLRNYRLRQRFRAVRDYFATFSSSARNYAGLVTRQKLRGHRTHHRYRGRSFAISENYQRALFHVSASSKLLQQVSRSLPV